MTWLTENWEGLVGAITALHVVALFIVNLTPTPKDDEFVGKIYRWVETFAGLMTKEGRGVK